MNLFGLTKTASLGGKRYAFYVVDGYSRLTLVLFLSRKVKAILQFNKLCKKIQNEKGVTVSKLDVIIVENLKINT